MDFLSKVTKSLLDSGEKEQVSKEVRSLAEGKHVLVIGGGDTGNDCVGTSIRLGAKSVTQLEMMPKAQRDQNSFQPLAPVAQSPENRLRPGRSHRRLRS